MKINPVFRKELKLSVRTKNLPIILVVYNAVLAIIGLVFFYSMLQQMRWSGNINYNTMTTLYVILSCVEFGLLVFIVPAITANAICGERERQTLDILLTTRMSTWNIISGKLMSSVNTIVLLIISSIPVLSLIFVFGGVNILDILKTVLYLVFIAIYIAAIGMACSVRFKKTTSATVMTYASVCLIGFGTLFVVFMSSMIVAVRSGYNTQSIGMFALLLLINPGVTFGAMLVEQVGYMGNISSMVIRYGVPEIVGNHWIIISIIVQVVIIVLFLVYANRRLNPLRKRRKRS